MENLEVEKLDFKLGRKKQTGKRVRILTKEIIITSK
jgi:hypothetical protein